MAWNDKGNARKCLSDYPKSVFERSVTRIHAPLNRSSNFREDSHVMSMLPIFHSKPSEEPYRHVDELSQVMKMKLSTATLRDQAKDWSLKLGKEFTIWT